MKIAPWILIGLFAAAPAYAQNGQPVPSTPIRQGSTWTPAQWIAAFASKADVSNGALTGATVRAGPSASATTPATRSPLFIFNDYNPTTAPVAGYSPGCQVWIGNNPTATPGSGDTVGCTWYVDNLNNRSGIWNGDFVANHLAAGSGGTGGPMRNLELEIIESYSLNTDPFSGLSRSTGIEQVVAAGSTYNATAARMTWANDTTGVGWWYNGDVFSRVKDVGIKFVVNPGGASDTGTAFGTAAISDESNSARVMKVAGSHSIMFDISAATSVGTFIKGSNSAGTSIGLSNQANFGANFYVDSGSSSAQQSRFSLDDRGIEKWWLLKQADNSFNIYNASTGQIDLSINPTTDTIQTNSHIAFSGSSAPTVTSCGTSASVASGSSDTRGVINVGSGTVTACTLNFNQSFGAGVFGRAACVVTGYQIGGAIYISGASATTETFSSAGNMAGGNIDYFCPQ